MTMPQKTPSVRRTYLIAGAAAIVVLLASMLIIRFGVESTGSVSTPFGVASTMKGTKVQLSWNAVSGASSYEVIRDGNTVIYSGSDKIAVDAAVPAGKHSYVVRAIKNGVRSASSTDETVTIDSSWGVYQPFVDTISKLMPKTPAAQGWEGVYCEWAIQPRTAEIGPSPLGSGKVQSRARVNCNGSPVYFAVGWLVSKATTDSYFADNLKRPGMEAITWDHGTGYFDPTTSTVVLRTDLVENAWIGLGGASGKDGLIALANKMPIE